MATGLFGDFPNYAGEVFTASLKQTPFLSMIGGLTGGKNTLSREFAMSSLYALSGASQPAITETGSLTAPAAANVARTQVYNTVQIFQKSVDLSYVALSNYGAMSGLNAMGQVNPVTDLNAEQIRIALEQIAIDMEYSFLNGAYQLAANDSTAAKTRGVLTACTTTAINATAGALTKALMDEALRTAYAGGARFNNTVLMVNAFQKQKLSTIYGYAPMDRNIGGVNVKQIETDFGTFGIILNPQVPTSVVAGIDVSVCTPVMQPVPGKGNFFYEALGKSGAAEKGQIFGQAGIDYGAEFLHFKIYGLATS